MAKKHEHPFYGQPIYRKNQQEYIEALFKKYRKEAVTDDLKKKIWDELQMEKYHGRVTIPFKVVTRRDASGLFPDYIEIILDSKV